MTARSALLHIRFDTQFNPVRRNRYGVTESRVSV